MAGVNRRTFTKWLGLGGLIGLAGFSFGQPKKFGRINVNEHGPWYRAWLNGEEVSAKCYEANDIEGYVLCFKRDERGLFVFDRNANDMVREKFTGEVRIERDKKWQPAKSI